jgi:hypothetical protein
VRAGDAENRNRVAGPRPTSAAVRARASAQKAQRELGEVRKILKARIQEAVV